MTAAGQARKKSSVEGRSRPLGCWPFAPAVYLGPLADLIAEDEAAEAEEAAE